MNSYEEKKQRLIKQIQSKQADHKLGLNKHTSNLYRDRQPGAKYLLDVGDLNKILQIDSSNQWVIAEGMTTYADLVDATLAHGLMPTVVPELKSITVGGAVAGIGIESSSFKYGLVHETILELDILLGDGRVVTCTPNNEHSDLFFAFANSYGTLGYALKVKVKCVPVKPYVRLKHYYYRNPKDYFKDLETWCRKDVDFVDGTVFAPKALYITVGTLTDQAPYTSDYTLEKIYYRSIQEKKTDYLTTLDFIWRWDTDWFWCSKNLYMQNPYLRRLMGKSRLNSITYTKIMRWNSRWGITRRVYRMLGKHTETVIQDVDIPIEKGAAFLDFFHREIGIKPIWICPIHAHDEDRCYELYRLDPRKIYVNFGFWDVVTSRRKLPMGHYNRRIERQVAKLGGIKSLYSDSFYPPEIFWQIYNQPAYDHLKAKYDPQHALPDLYEKCVLRA